MIGFIIGLFIGAFIGVSRKRLKETTEKELNTMLKTIIRLLSHLKNLIVCRKKWQGEAVRKRLNKLAQRPSLVSIQANTLYRNS